MPPDQPARFGDPLGVANVPGDVDLKPHVFDDVAGHDGRSQGRWVLAVVHRDPLQEHVPVPSHEVLEDVVRHGQGGVPVTRLVEHGAQLPKDEAEDHGQAVYPGAGRDRIRRVRDPVVRGGQAA